jgi:hypothetical protein
VRAYRHAAACRRSCSKPRSVSPSLAKNLAATRFRRSPDWATTIALDDEPSIVREQQLLAGVTLADVDPAQNATSIRTTRSSER